MEEILTDNIELQRLSKNEINQVLTSCIEKSGFEIIDNNQLNTLFNYKIVKEERIFNVSAIVKNVSNSGWKNKPFIKRIQTAPLLDVLPTKRDSCYLLLGIVKYKEEYLLISWNANRYVKHKTLRSAYVNVYALDMAYKDGFFRCNDFNDNILICDSYNFDKLLYTYIDYTLLEDY